VLLPLSVLLIKYYPGMGIHYDQWIGRPEYVGVTTSKNMLGALCLITGLFFFWDTVRRWPARRVPETKRILTINIIFIAMTLWLINLSNSATSRTCLFIGCAIIILAHTRWAKMNPRRVLVAIPVAVATYLLLDFAFDLSSFVAELLGREQTLTGRTGMWNALLAVPNNPVLGAGYQSFWLGDRLTTVWKSLDVVFLNEAHNGYLEMYLNLGLFGLVLLGLFMASAYRIVSRQLNSSAHFASLSLALWSILMFYNITEVAFGGSLLWFSLLLLTTVVPRVGAEMPLESKNPVTKKWIQHPASLPGDRRV